MSDNTILGIKPFSDYMNVAEVALKVMQGKSPIKEEWIDDEARKVEHKWKRMNTKARTKWLAQIKKMADKEDMDKEDLDAILSQYGLLKFDNELVWDEAQKIKPKWKKMSTAERTQWVDKMHVLAVKARTSDADVQSILDDAKLKIKEEVEEEVELTELLKSKDKSVIDAFYKEDSLVGRVLSTDGKSLEKHGVGGQTIAAWLKDKIAITAVSDVKSTESILRYMKNSIPKLNFDPKSYKKFFEEVEATRMPMEAPFVLVDESELTESTTTDKKNTFGMAPFKDLKNVADAALKIMTRQPQEVKEEEKEEEKEEVTKEDQPQQLTE